MRFSSPLVPARLIQRYKRFLADVELSTGETVTAHCANPGAMIGLCAPGARVFLSRADNPARKLAWNWELTETDFGAGATLVGINTSHPNRLVEEALREGRLPELSGYASVRREVKYGANSRIDFLLESPGRPPCYLEVKNVHMCRRAGHAEFPDCATARAAKHLSELANVVRTGGRAVMLYVIQMRAGSFSLATDIDPVYAAASAAARAAGVEMLAYDCAISPEGIKVATRTQIID
jgi:sugar fermentation stimulation protein A